MKKTKKTDDLPLELQQEVSENGEAMQKFYTMPTDQRQYVLDKIVETNEKLEDLD